MSHPLETLPVPLLAYLLMSAIVAILGIAQWIAVRSARRLDKLEETLAKHTPPHELDAVLQELHRADQHLNTLLTAHQLHVEQSFIRKDELDAKLEAIMGALRRIDDRIYELAKTKRHETG